MFTQLNASRKVNNIAKLFLITGKCCPIILILNLKTIVSSGNHNLALPENTFSF